MLSDRFGITMALGSVCNVEQVISQALAAPVQEVHEAVKQSAVVHADETSYPNQGWLGVAVTTYLAIFLIQPRRDKLSAMTLFRCNFGGIACSDRYSSYQWLKTSRRQLCWAHLLRDFQALVDRGGASARLGLQLQALADEMFDLWYQVRDGTRSRLRLQLATKWIRRPVGDLLREGQACAHAKTAGTCQKILQYEAALWTFVDVAGIEPTNNTAERALRQAVLWRRKSCGTRSEVGAQYVGSILSVVTTCRLQGRNVLDYVTAACVAAARGQAVPSLLPSAKLARRAS